MKKGFSLIEIMVSITLLAIIFSYFYGSVNSLKRSTNFYENKFNSLEDLKRYIAVLQQDIILNIGEVKILSEENKDYSILKVRTKNSLYNIDVPYVVWYVNKRKSTLSRIESVREINLPIKEDFHFFNLDEVAIGLNSFKLYKSNDLNNTKDILTYIDQRGFSKIVFETPGID
ncbi:MAG: Prokaryotic N-terminal methylation motif domain protein [uncultured Campylobacterales bacterium]|uniref:Prokaryotic N-terminal methylation motif domain protein n=1 Tax=uncultured Campylobacterales bacterium TaxID=352960 RepID=A0A6S6T590_9BACT|nr:MAG: Prokaryotic N-terminal methylation motif domain protein [uncultured Campylobacterales bacterium]